MNYELACILSPKIMDKELESEIGKIDKILSDNKVDNFEKNVWGKKELAYPINNFLDGYYVQYNFISEPEGISKIDSKLRLEEKVIRFLLIKQEPEKENKKAGKKDKKAKKVEKNEEIKETEKVEEIKEVKEEKIKVEKEEKIKNKDDFDKKLDEVLGKDLTD
jgi:small subunit ribosomal protein S6